MPVFARITSGDLVLGTSVVGGGKNAPSVKDWSPEASGGGSVRAVHWASGDALNLFAVLDGRYKAAPSGWSA